ncbi:MAG: beta-lactamase family protein [Planctomycetes bacterium]|nr:beta-lactamase family protein [Planctomycetota bacterium]
MSRLLASVRFAALMLVVQTALAQAPAWVEKVDAAVAARLAQPGAVGFSVAVAQDGAVLLEKGYGRAECEFDVPANAATSFRIGSITKQFTAALVMRAVAAGKVALDDDLSKFVPEFPLQGKKVTIHRLLDHSSGIPSYTDVGPEWQKQWPLELTHEQLLALVAGKPFDFEPGTDWHYNNTGYYLLGMVLEKVHGKSYAEVVQDEIATPLGLSRTRYDSNKDLIPNRAQGYDVVGGKLANDDLLGMNQPGAAGGLIASAGDLVRWSMALAGGKVVSKEAYAQMTTPLVLPGGRDTGYGFGLMRGEVLGMPAIQHGGGIHGFNSMLMFFPERALHVAVISNCDRASSDKLAKGIARAVLGVPEFVAKDLPVPAELRTACAGDYDFKDVGLVLSITVDGEKLRGQGKADGQQPFAMLFQGGREFRAAFDHEVRLVFGEDGKALVLHQGGGVFTGRRVGD